MEKNLSRESKGDEENCVQYDENSVPLEINQDTLYPEEVRHYLGS